MIHNNTDSHNSFRSDCARFVAYGTLGQQMPPPVIGESLHVLSALHVEMKCWEAGSRPMNPRIYARGNALHNAWTAMRVRGASMAPDPANLMQEAGEILLFVLDRTCLNNGDPVQDWDETFTLADYMLKRAAVASATDTAPAALTTLGMRQKVWSILIKYFASWHFTETEFPVVNLNLSVDWNRYVHAFHAPLDRRILNTLANLPVGRFIGKFIQNGNLRQSDGTLVPWSKLEDAATWWAYQFLMRRFASVGFPGDQPPSLGKVMACEFADAVASIPVDVLVDSLRKMSPTDPPPSSALFVDNDSEDEMDLASLEAQLLETRRQIELLERQLSDMQRNSGSTQSQTIKAVDGSSGVTGARPTRPGENPVIHLRQTGNASYIKVLLGEYAGNNFALIGRNLKTLSLKKSCERDFPDLWKAFQSLTPKPYSMGGSTPHGGVGYGGTADITKDGAIKLFTANGFSVIDETHTDQGKPMEYHPG
jgi:hypothetical protein